MTSVTSACLCWTLLAVCVVVLASEDEDVITAEVGQTVTLTCRAPNNKTIQAVKWSRGDPGDQYVLLFQDGQFDPGNQHPSFRNRVDLQDRQMNMSLILKNVTINDDGAYECQVLVGETRSWETVSISYLSVHPADQSVAFSVLMTRGSGELTKDGIIVISVFVVAAVILGSLGFLMYRLYKRRQRSNRARINFRSVQSTNTQP